MMEKGKRERGVVELVDTESLVPQEHLLREVDRAAVFIDETHIKVSPNLNKKIKQEVAAAAKRYWDELLAEINADREAQRISRIKLHTHLQKSVQ